jgi:hypothetical protein
LRTVVRSLSPSSVDELCRRLGLNKTSVAYLLAEKMPYSEDKCGGKVVVVYYKTIVIWHLLRPTRLATSPDH